MGKPVTIPIKKWLIRRVAVDTVIDEKIIDRVISHQFETAREKMNSCNSIELSGFGRFYFNRNKALNKLKTYKNMKQKFEDIINDKNTVDRRRYNIQLKLGTLIGDIKLLERKLQDED